MYSSVITFHHDWFDSSLNILKENPSFNELLPSFVDLDLMPCMAIMYFSVVAAQNCSKLARVHADLGKDKVILHTFSLWS